MDSFEPFCSILAPETPENTPTTLAKSSSFTERNWKHFDLYSTRTKTLVLNEPASLSKTPSWAFHMGRGSNARSGVFFPSLRGLFLNYADPLSFFIAFAVAPHLVFLSIHLRQASATEESKGAILELTQHLRQKNTSLSHVHVIRPFQQEALDNLLALKTLKAVQVVTRIAEHVTIKQPFWAASLLVVREAGLEQESEEHYTSNRNLRVLTPAAAGSDQPARALPPRVQPIS
ncbi:hypothetical protein FA13DRAFT_1820241 [Coprinellus micaceus]|uniref:Uncharacterized protein n=1 Tax=Coprinellus micaceus TaxID=71717 RepID=A0A4Y7SFF3_COPMI|nr:hypothetical protein FA13DRAFT_1820241 [Coprinellus micaceus]